MVAPDICHIIDLETYPFDRPGDLSMHLVSPVRGQRKRIFALFCYDRNPGTTFDLWYIEELEQGLCAHAR